MTFNFKPGRFFVPVAVVILVMAVGVLKAKTDAAATRKRITEHERTIAAMRDEARGLAAEVQYLENPRRIDALARRELGMAPAERDQKKGAEALETLNAPEKAPQE